MPNNPFEDGDDFEPIEDPDVMPHRSKRLPKMPDRRMTKGQLVAWERFVEQYRDALEEEERRGRLKRYGY